MSEIKKIKKITLVISQPQTGSRPDVWDFLNGEAVTHSEGVVSGHAKVVMSLVGKPVEEITEHLVPGDEQCKYCKAKAKCPKLAQEVDLASAQEFGIIPSAGLAGFVSMSPTDLAALYLKMPLIEAWCEAVKKSVEADAMAGKIGPEHGLKVIAGKLGNRAWANAEVVESEMKSMRIKQEQMYNFTLISPTAAEKLLADNPRKWKKLSEHITRSPGGKKVVSVEAKGEAIDMRPNASGFEDVTGDGDDLC